MNEELRTKTLEWLKGIKSSTEKMNHWLKRQFIGERLAAIRVNDLAQTLEGKQKAVFERVAFDESQHAFWIQTLLANRGLPFPDINDAGKNFASTTRYWRHLNEGMTLEELFAAGAHAEEMRLYRIEALSADEEIDSDIRETFKRILSDEKFHAAAFRKAAGEKAYRLAKGNHEMGLRALGLAA